MMWMVDIQGFRHVTVHIANFLYLLLLSFLSSFYFSYYSIFAAYHGGDSHLSLKGPSSIPGQIIIL